jgi:hypothetical protein
VGKIVDRSAVLPVAADAPIRQGDAITDQRGREHGRSGAPSAEMRGNVSVTDAPHQSLGCRCEVCPVCPIRSGAGWVNEIVRSELADGRLETNTGRIVTHETIRRMRSSSASMVRLIVLSRKGDQGGKIAYMEETWLVEHIVVFAALPTTDELLAADVQASSDRFVEHAATFLRSDPDYGWEILVCLVVLDGLGNACHGRLP